LSGVVRAFGIFSFSEASLAAFAAAANSIKMAA
jgi:hypothetical protein